LKEWFILQFKSNSHHQAVRNLNQIGLETFLPTHNITSREDSRFTCASRPLFPGYMFISFSRENTHWRKINSIYVVSQLFKFNSILKPVPNCLINDLMSRLDISKQSTPAAQLKKGNHIKFIHGPFTNFIATIEKLEFHQLILILMDILGRKTKM